MKMLLPLIALMILAALIKVFAKEGKSKVSFKANKFLMSDCELKFYKVLAMSLDNNETVFTKVRQADIFTPDANRTSKSFWIMFNKISQKHVDFVLCDKVTSEIKVIVELNDASHDKPRQIKRDIELRQTAESAGVRLVTVKASNGYSVKKIRELIYGDAHGSGAELQSEARQIEIRN